MLYDAFWSSPHAKKLEHPEVIRPVLEALERDPELLFHLLFHARFAVKTFDVMKREGKDSQGFERMQQSFMESVQEIESILAQLPLSPEVGGLVVPTKAPLSSWSVRILPFRPLSRFICAPFV